MIKIKIQHLFKSKLKKQSSIPASLIWSNAITMQATLSGGRLKLR